MRELFVKFVRLLNFLDKFILKAIVQVLLTYFKYFSTTLSALFEFFRTLHDVYVGIMDIFENDFFGAIQWTNHTFSRTFSCMSRYKLCIGHGLQLFRTVIHIAEHHLILQHALHNFVAFNKSATGAHWTFLLTRNFADTIATI